MSWLLEVLESKYWSSAIQRQEKAGVPDAEDSWDQFHLGESESSLSGLMVQILISFRNADTPRNNALSALYVSLNPVTLAFKIVHYV